MYYEKSRWRLVQILGAVIVLAAAVVACTGCSGLQTAGGDLADGARERMLAWWEAEGKAKARDLAGELAEEAKRRAVEEATKIGSEKLREAEGRLAGHGVDASKIDSLAAALEAWRKIQEEEKRSGKPYSGNSMLDIALALFAARYAGKGVDTAAKKLMQPPAKPTP